MANIKYVCESCEAFVIAKPDATRPYWCAFCGGYLEFNKSIKAAPPLNLKKIKSVYSGKTAQQIQSQLPPTARLGNGVDRVAYALDNEYVLKVARRDAARKANHIEVNRWHNSPPQLKQYLAPIIDWADDYEWVVMARANNIGHGQHFPTFVHDEIGDLHSYNTGTINNKPVIIDYVGGGADWQPSI